MSRLVPIAIVSVILALVLAGRAEAHHPGQHGKDGWSSFRPVPERGWNLWDAGRYHYLGAPDWPNSIRGKTNAILRSKCLSTYELGPRPTHPHWIKVRLSEWKDKRDRAREASSACVPQIPSWPWLALAECESGQTWNYNGSSGFDGGFQFLPSTWIAAGGAARGYSYAWQAPAYVQYLVAKSWLARTSWSQWPVCSRVIGAR